MDTPLEIYLGEIIEASSTTFTARCRELNAPPAFGSFVRVGEGIELPDDPFEKPGFADGAIYAVVTHAQTAGIDSNRKAVAYGKNMEELRREQPQIFELLATDFSCLTLGHSDKGVIRNWLPPYPPVIHSRVFSCTSEEICGLTDKLDYMRTILNNPGLVTSEELLAAVLRLTVQSHAKDPEYVVRAGKQLAMLLWDDYDRLHTILCKQLS